VHETRDSNWTSTAHLLADRRKREAFHYLRHRWFRVCDDRFATLIFMTDRFGNALPLTINPPNVLIHRLPIARNRARDIYILTFPSRFHSTFLYSFVLPVSRRENNSERTSKEQKHELAFGMRRVSSVCYFAVNSRLALVTPFAFRDSGSFLSR